MSELHTSSELLRALEGRATTTPSPDQRVSFVMGSLPQERDATREEVERVLNDRSAGVRRPR